jgi:hypothetical protein
MYVRLTTEEQSVERGGHMVRRFQPRYNSAPVTVDNDSADHDNADHDNADHDNDRRSR